jgi:accessory gene regulator B
MVMITQMSKRISSFFIINNIVKDDDREVYEYSFEILISTILNFLAVIVIAIITKRIVETMIYLLGFIPLRTIAGGYHAKTHFRCFMILMATYMSFLLIVRFVPVNWMDWITIVSAFLSFVLIFWLSPVEDSNKPLSEKEKNTFRIKSRICITAYSMISILLLLVLPNPIYGVSLSLGIVSVSFSQLAKVVLMPIRH